MPDKQQVYFDQAKHQFPVRALLHPSRALQTEYQDLERMLALPPGSPLIDFGSGNGRVTLDFLRRGYQVTAVDISSQSLTVLSELDHRHRHASWGTFKTATSLPPHSAVAGIIGADILHHLNLAETLPRLFQTLRPGGHVAFSEPNGWYLPWYAYIVLAKLPWSVEKNICYNYVFNLKKAFNAAGFVNVRMQGHGLIPTTLAPYAWNFRLGTYVTPIAFRLLISAERPQ